MINDAAREVGVDRREFGNFIEKLKKNQHRGSSRIVKLSRRV